VLPPDGSIGPDGNPLPATPVWGAGWAPDGRTLLLGANEGDVVKPSGGYLAAVDTETWEVEKKFPTGAVQSLETAPDERLIAATSASAAETVLLDAKSLEVVKRIPLAERGTDLSFSPDGRMLAVGGQSGALYVFDTGTWHLLAGPAVLHERALVQVEWLADGRTVATSGEDGVVTLFDVERGLARGRPLHPSGGVGQGVVHLMPGPTDELVVLGGELPGRRYSLVSSVWVEEACAVVGRDLTRDEWERYLPGRPYERSCS
jgi:WD40 repeat protein